jgi:choline-glycine betaine transporter
MIFSAGVAVGLFFYGAAEPIWLSNGNRYTEAAQGGTSQFEDAQWAMTQTIFHWGFHGWIPYQVVGMTVGIAHYRQGLPMTIRSCFYPIMGNGIYGWFGDAIDALSIVTIVGGVCTSLGLGTMAIASGILRLSPDLWGLVSDKTDEDEMKNVNSVIIALITLLATASVVSGLNYGIKWLSILAFNGGMFLLFTVLFMDNTWFFLNLMVQTFGHYFQNILMLSFFTDCFAEIGKDGNGSQGAALSEAPDGFYGDDKSLMAPWTIFYWGWWISWAPFVGTFLARISKGRTVAQLIMYSLVAPLLYCIIWFCVFGGAAIKDQWTFQNAVAANEYYDLHKNTTSYETFVDEATGIDCITVNAGGIPVACNLLSSASADQMFFLLLQSYEPYGDFLAGVAVFCLTVYFITSSDSGSLVVDTIAANGKDCSVVQRVLWSFTEGAVAIGLMQAGGSASTGALQAISVVMGLPYTIVLCFMCVSLSISCAQEDKMLKGDRTGLLEGSQQACRSGFKLELYRGIFDILEFFCSFDAKYLTEPRCFVASIVPFLRDSILPFVTVFTCLSKLGKGKMSIYNTLIAILAVVFHILWVSLRVATVADDEYASLSAFSWTFFVGFVCIVTQVRTQVRLANQIDGNIVEDFLASFLYPMVLMQCAVQVEESNDAVTKPDTIEVTKVSAEA